MLNEVLIVGSIEAFQSQLSVLDSQVGFQPESPNMAASIYGIPVYEDPRLRPTQFHFVHRDDWLRYGHAIIIDTSELAYLEPDAPTQPGHADAASPRP